MATTAVDAAWQKNAPSPSDWEEKPISYRTGYVLGFEAGYTAAKAEQDTLTTLLTPSPNNLHHL